MRIIFIIACCFLCNQLKAQQAKLSHEDSMEIQRISNEPKIGYVFADETGYSFSEYDFERANKRVSYLTDSNRFSWPHRMRSRPQTPTYDYLLEHKYHITFEDIRPDCIEELWFTLHDSLMDVEIKKNMGTIFTGILTLRRYFWIREAED